MFNDSKYTKWYFSIVTNATKRITPLGYIERHHITPKSLGGSDDPSNLVALTAREHFICHLLLSKMTSGSAKVSMLHAIGMFAQARTPQTRILTSWEYQKVRESISKARTGRKFSDEAKKKMSEAAKGRVPHNKGKTGFKHSDETKAKIGAASVGKIRSAVTIKKMSEAKLGHTSGMTGKKHSEETLLKMSNSHRAKK